MSAHSTLTSRAKFAPASSVQDMTSSRTIPEDAPYAMAISSSLQAMRVEASRDSTYVLNSSMSTIITTNAAQAFAPKRKWEPCLLLQAIRPTLAASSSMHGLAQAPPSVLLPRRATTTASPYGMSLAPIVTTSPSALAYDWVSASNPHAQSQASRKFPPSWQCG